MGMTLKIFGKQVGHIIFGDQFANIKLTDLKNSKAGWPHMGMTLKYLASKLATHVNHRGKCIRMKKDHCHM